MVKLNKKIIATVAVVSVLAIIATVVAIVVYAFDFSVSDKYEVTSEPVGNMNIPRSGHSSFLMDDGRVFIIGRHIRNKEYPTCEDKKLTAEIFDPKTRKFTVVENFPVYNASVTMLKDGKFLLLYRYECINQKEVENPTITALIYDPRTGISEKIQDLNYSGQKILLDDGNVFLLVDGNPSLSLLYDYKIKKFVPLNAKFKDNISFGSGGRLSGDREPAVKLMNGNILIVGGLRDRYVNTKKVTNLKSKYNSIIYDYKKNMFIPIKGVNKIDVRSVSIHTPVLLKNGDVLVCEDGYLGHWPICEIFDHKTEKFRVIKPMNEARKYYSMILLADGKVLVAGGNRSSGYALNVFLRPSTLYDSVEIFNPETEKFTLIENVIKPKAGFSTVLLKDNSVLITGGLGREFYGPEPGQVWPGWENFKSDNAQKADILTINTIGDK